MLELGKSCWFMCVGWEIAVFSPLPSGKGERKREDAPGEGLSLGLTCHGDLLAKKEDASKGPRCVAVG